MTIKELYEWAVKNKVTNYSVTIQYRDDGGYYSGTEDLDECNIEINQFTGEVIL